MLFSAIDKFQSVPKEYWGLIPSPNCEDYPLSDTVLDTYNNNEQFYFKAINIGDLSCKIISLFGQKGEY